MTATPLDLAVMSLSDLPPAERLEPIWKAFEADLQKSIARPPTNEERALVAEWLKWRRKDGNFEAFLLRDTYLRSLAHRTPAEKAGLLAQGGCDSCEPVTTSEDARAALSIFGPINVEPWSAQTTAGKVAIREAVQAKMQARDWHEPVAEETLCLRIVSFVPRSRRRMDVDNLVKGLLDSLEGVLYVNDWQIQCLTTRRILSRARAGAYLLSAQVVYPYETDVVYDDGSPLNIPFERIEVRGDTEIV
jgi:hypothetical protein